MSSTADREAANRQCILFAIRAGAWAFGSIFVAYLFFIDAHGLWISGGRTINGWAIFGRDFANVFSSGRLVIEGKEAIIYDVEAYRAWQTAYFGSGIRLYNYSYSPITLLYTPIFGLISYRWSFALWEALSILAFAIAARPWLSIVRLPVAAAVALPATLVCVWAGHYGLFIGALWLGTWHNLGKRPALAGVLTGLMVVKPHLAILLPLIFVLRREWVAILFAAATVMVLAGLSVLVYGAGLWETYFSSTTGYQISLVSQTNSGHVLMMPSLAPALFSYGFSPEWVWGLQAAVAAGTIFALCRFLPKDDHQAGMAVAVATFLALPYAFNYDMTVIGLAAAMLLYRPNAEAKPYQALIAASVFILPTMIIVILNRAGFWLSPVLLAMMLFCLLQRGALPAWQKEAAS